MAEYVYRGQEDDAMVEELQDRAIYGEEHTIYRGELGSIAALPDDPTGMKLDDLGWVDRRTEEVCVTGGVTSDLAQTHRFNGASSYSMVLDSAVLPFEPIQYEYDWFNRHPGGLDHIASHAAGEIRLERRGSGIRDSLRGLAKTTARLNEPNVTEVRDWGKGDTLPGMGPRTKFADEAEWVAFRCEVSLKGAIEGVVSVVTPLDIRVAWTRGKEMIPKDAPDYTEIAPDVYEQYRDPLPEWTTYYLLVVDDFQDYKKSNFGGWREQDVLAAYRDDGEIPPASVPPRFRGEN